MNLLDENVPRDQRELLERWNIKIQQIGIHVGRLGMLDEAIIPLLLKLRRATFFTRDAGFYDASLRHAKYGLVFLDVDKYESASFIRRFLRHAEFNTQVKRMGMISRLSSTGIWLLKTPGRRETHVNW